MTIGLAGFGTVGQALARLLVEGRPPLRLTHVFNRHVARKVVDWIPGDVRWTERVEDLFEARVDILVELMGGVEPAGTIIRSALDAGCHVVTANKKLLAECGGELLAHAAARDRFLGFEAAVGGGIPVIRGVQGGLAGDRLVRVSGILNGTCNYMLTRIEAEGLPFEAALADAQRLGFAEADPTDDLDGFDARSKLCVLARVALKETLRPDQVPCRSIRPIEPIDFAYARRLQCTIRQVARVQRTGAGDALAADVGPALVRDTSPLARVLGSENLIETVGEHGGRTSFAGRGAGGGPTAVAVLSDLLAIASGSQPAPRYMAVAARPTPVTHDVPAPHYLRFVVRDRPGIIAALAQALSAEAINIEAVLQEPWDDRSALPFVVTVEPCTSGQLARALEAIAALDFHTQPVLSLPIYD